MSQTVEEERMPKSENSEDTTTVESVFPGIPLVDIEVAVHVAPALQRRFSLLATKWKNETGLLSNVTKKCTHPAYQQIIGMGCEVLPLILRDLRESNADWFWALTAITGANPISTEIAGNITRMTEAWLQWARAKGYDV
jgi:hypothetical protein